MTKADETPIDLPAPPPRALEVEQNGLNSIDVAERRGRPRELFWPWFAANISVLGINDGAFLLGFGVSFPQAVGVGVVGIIISFLLCGLVSLSGKRGHAPTMTLSRAAFGVNGELAPLRDFLAAPGRLGDRARRTRCAGHSNRLHTAGMERRLLHQGRRPLPRGSPHPGRRDPRLRVHHEAADVHHRDHCHPDRRLRHPRCLQHRLRDACRAAGRPNSSQLIGAFVFMLTGFGLGWVNAAGDYSRYLPRQTSSAGVVGWTTFGASLGPVLLLIIGVGAAWFV